MTANIDWKPVGNLKRKLCWFSCAYEFTLNIAAGQVYTTWWNSRLFKLAIWFIIIAVWWPLFVIWIIIFPDVIWSFSDWCTQIWFVLRPVLTCHKKVAEPSANRVTRSPTMSTRSSDRWTSSRQQQHISSKTRKFHWRIPSLSSTIPTFKRPEIRPAVCVAFGAPIRYRNPSTPKCPKSTNPQR